MSVSSAKSEILPVDRATLERLADLLLERAGLKISSEGFHSLRLAMSARLPLAKTNSPSAYLDWVQSADGEQELRSLIPLVTVGYTEFFRDTRQFHALECRIIPDLLALARRENRTAEIWSAGCATGEEPYSIAMVLHQVGAAPTEARVYATDLNHAAVENARAGIYPARRLSGIGSHRLTRYFHPAPAGGFEVDPLLRAYVQFDGHNLASPAAGRMTPRSLDLVLCRNVIIYFDLPTIKALMERFLTWLRPGGYLFLGYSESLFKVYDKFEMVEVEGAFVYRRPLDTPSPPKVAAPVVPVAPPRRFTPTATPAVRRPSQEIPVVSRPPPPRRTTSAISAALQIPAPQIGSSVSIGRTPQERLDAAVHHMNQGDFEGARSLLESLTHQEPNDLDALLTLGNLRSLFGEHARARESFNLALKREPLCVDARIFLGVAALQEGQLADARSELTKALFLEPTLALGHYLLAQVHERSKQHDDARRAYRNAIAQLRFPQRTLAGHYPDVPDSTESIHRAARYALAALEEA